MTDIISLALDPSQKGLPIVRITSTYPGLLEEVGEERKRQLRKWGEQSHADGTGTEAYQMGANAYKALNDRTVAIGADPNWDTILLEEVFEALAESDPVKLREELIQSAAVCIAWVEDLDSREH